MAVGARRAIAANIANANTPGFAPDLQPFSAVLDTPRRSMMARPTPRISRRRRRVRRSARGRDRRAGDDAFGNSVNVENEMMKLGEVNRDYTMATNIKRVIHQMIMSALK